MKTYDILRGHAARPHYKPPNCAVFPVKRVSPAVLNLALSNPLKAPVGKYLMGEQGRSTTNQPH